MREPTANCPAAELELVNIEKRYEGPPPVDVLKSIALQIMEGEMVAVTGRSGSGKTTLLNVLGLLDRPSSGSYRIRGVETATLPESAVTALRASHFGFVFQAFHLLPDRSARENAELGLLYRGRSPSARRQTALHALERVGLGHRLNSVPAMLSGGERQRVAIARALTQSPRVLLCDEPTGNLDRANSDGVVRLLRDLNQERLTVVVVTHDLEVASAMDRVIHIDDGHLAAETVDVAICDHPRNRA